FYITRNRVKDPLIAFYVSFLTTLFLWLIIAKICAFMREDKWEARQPLSPDVENEEIEPQQEIINGDNEAQVEIEIETSEASDLPLVVHLPSAIDLPLVVHISPNSDFSPTSDLPPAYESLEILPSYQEASRTKSLSFTDNI